MQTSRDDRPVGGRQYPNRDRAGDRWIRWVLPIVLAFASHPTIAQLAGGEPLERISAFPCIVCPGGGEVLGILPKGGGRAVKAFGAFKEFCVSDYRYDDGELQVRFKLDGRLWPDAEDFALLANSWQALCRSVQWSTSGS